MTAQREEKRTEDRAESTSAPKKAVVSIMDKQSSSLTKNLPSKKSPSYSNTSVTKPPLKPAGSFKGVIPKKPWPSSGSVPSKPSPLSHGSSVAKKAAPSSSLSGGLKKPPLSSMSAAAGSSQAKTSANPAQSQPNSQIRQNIRRSLKEILWKRWEFKTLLYRKLHLEVACRVLFVLVKNFEGLNLCNNLLQVPSVSQVYI